MTGLRSHQCTNITNILTMHTIPMFYVATYHTQIAVSFLPSSQYTLSHEPLRSFPIRSALAPPDRRESRNLSEKVSSLDYKDHLSISSFY